MIIDYTISIIRLVFQLLFLLVLAYVIISFLLPQSNTFRRVVDRIVEPLLRPIQRIVKPYQNIDFSPLILVILLQIIMTLLISGLNALR